MEFLHGFIIGVAVIVMVYGGEQIKASNASCYILKISVASAALSLLLIVTSIWFALKGNYYESNISALRSADTKNDLALGFNSAMQNFYNEWNQRFTCCSVLLLTISIAAYATGVCLL